MIKAIGKPRRHSRKAVLASLFLIILAGAIVYGNSLKGGFVWDDGPLVKDNVYLRDFSHLKNLLFEPIGAAMGRKDSFYRPFQMLTYLADHAVWKLNPMGYHLTNIALHILVALSIFWLVSILFTDGLLAVWTALLFVVHPIHTEAVSYISGRADSLVLLFMLLCFVFYIRNLRTKSAGSYALMLLSFLSALLSRENAFILPALIALYHYAFQKRFEGRPFFSLVGVAFVYIVLRSAFLKSTIVADSGYSTTVLERLPGFFVALTNYLRLLFLPFPLHMEYVDTIFPMTDVKAFFGLLILVFISIFAFKKRQANRLFFFAFGWFFIAILPVSNLYPIKTYMAEHWLYVSSIGFFLILAHLLLSLHRSKVLKNFGVFASVAFLGFYSVLTIRQNAYWKDALSLFEHTFQYAPGSARVANNLGLAYHDTGQEEEAIRYYKKAIELDPDLADTHSNLGAAYYNMGKKEEAIEQYKKAIALNPDYAQAYHNLGIVYADIGRTDEAIAQYEKAIVLNPNLLNLYNNLGVAYYRAGQINEALAMFKKVVDINPDHVGAYNNLANIYRAMGKREEAIALYKKVIDKDPRFILAYNNLGLIYQEMGRTEDAVAAYKKALAIDPHYTEALHNLDGLIGRTNETRNDL